MMKKSKNNKKNKNKNKKEEEDEDEKDRNHATNPTLSPSLMLVGSLLPIKNNSNN